MINVTDTFLLDSIFFIVNLSPTRQRFQVIFTFPNIVSEVCERPRAWRVSTLAFGATRFKPQIINLFCWFFYNGYLFFLHVASTVFCLSILNLKLIYICDFISVKHLHILFWLIQMINKPLLILWRCWWIVWASIFFFFISSKLNKWQKMTKPAWKKNSLLLQFHSNKF